MFKKMFADPTNDDYEQQRKMKKHKKKQTSRKGSSKVKFKRQVETVFSTSLNRNFNGKREYRVHRINNEPSQSGSIIVNLS